MKKLLNLCISALFIFIGVHSTVAQRITVTIAGSGIMGFTGDNGPAKLSRIGNPMYICVDGLGNIYFNDIGMVRKVSAKSGIITTVAGGGTSVADWVPATSEALNPQSLCADAAGNLFIVNVNKIERVDVTTGLIATFAGGLAGYAGDGGPALAARFSNIRGICLDTSGNLYVSDNNNNRIRKISAATGIVTTIAGTGTSGYTGDGGPATVAELYRPEYISWSALTGDLIFTDQDAPYIRKITGATGIINTIAGGGSVITNCLADNVDLSGLTGMCYDNWGNIVFNEISCSCRKLDHISDSVTYIGGDYVTESYRDDTNALYGWMNSPYGLAADAKNNIYVADQGNHRVRKLAQLSHTPTYVFGERQSITPCPGYSFKIDSTIGITDIDSAQTETWTVLAAPVNGTLSGFPATALSNGVNYAVRPSGTSYLAHTGFTGSDSFRVRVSDGSLADTLTIYVKVQMPAVAAITGPDNVCEGNYIALVDTTSLIGIWGVSNAHATVNTSGGVYGLTAGIDTISYTLLGTCAISSVRAITINTLPDAGTITGADTICLGAPATLSDSITGGRWSSEEIYSAVIDSITGSVTGIATGTTEISYTVTVGPCASVAWRDLRVMAPTTAISGYHDICAGSSTMLSDGSWGGVWTISNSRATIVSTEPSDMTIAGVSTGLDTVTYTNTNVCGTGTATFLVTVDPAVTPAVVTGPTSVCQGGSITLAASIAGGEWDYQNDNAFVGVFTGVVNGRIAGTDSITYTLNAYSGCSVTTPVLITIDSFPVAGSITGVRTVCAGSSITLGETVAGGAWSVADSFASVSLTGMVTGRHPGADSVQYVVTNACGSASTAVAIPVINSLPVAGTIIGESTVCVGAVFTMTDTTAGGTWNVTNPNAGVSTFGIVIGVAAGTDSVLYTVTNACGAVNAVSVITVNPLPAPGTITGPDSLCIETTLALAESVTGGVWSVSNANCSVDSTGLVSGITLGIDSIMYTVTNGCGSLSALLPLTVYNCNYAGVQKVNPISRLHIYPNPANDVLHLVWNSASTKVWSVTIADVAGRTVIRKSSAGAQSASEMLIDVSALADGVYLVRAATADGDYTDKLVISR